MKKLMLIAVLMCVVGCSSIEFAKNPPEPFEPIPVEIVKPKPFTFAEPYYGELEVVGKTLVYIDPDGVRQEVEK